MREIRSFRNPIISGYNPDPSICRVGDDFYIVNSTFEFFPGVPIYHSTNLVNWELIGYCLTEEEQDPLEGCHSSGGIYAPTIRYHEGTFFMTTTNRHDKGNFIVHTTDMSKGWSEPHWIDQGGIDPSIYFEDGKVYFCSTGHDEGTRKQGIWMCEINPFTGEKLTESVRISYGCGGTTPEGPHIYKKDGWYYLLLAEGGTEYHHMVTMQRSRDIYGPYEPCPRNPILSHKDQMYGDIFCTGHADIVEDREGNWWLVCLGTRASGNGVRRSLLHHLGRETFLSPMVWGEDGWPIVGNNGLIAMTMEGPLPGETPTPADRSFYDDFKGEELSLHYNYLRNPRRENYVLEDGKLLLKGTSTTLNEMASPTWIGIRQKDFDIEGSVWVDLVREQDHMRAGLTAYYNESYHYEIYVTKELGKYYVCLAKHVHDIFVVTAKAEIPENNVKLLVKADKGIYAFYYEVNGQEVLLGTGLVAGLCTEGTLEMTFTGVYIGMFAELGDAEFSEFQVKIL